MSRVLLVTYNFAPKVGGLEQVVHHVWELLRVRAETTTIAQGARGFVDGAAGVLRPRREGLLAFLAFVYWRGSRLARRGAFDIVVSGSALTALPTLHLARIGKAKTAAFIHGLDTIYPASVYQRVYRYAMPKMDRVIANSRATRDEAVLRGVPSDRIRVIHPGCDPSPLVACQADLVRRLRSQWGLERARIVLVAGRLARRKGAERFVRECLPRIVQAIPDVKLLVAGGNPPGALVHRADVRAGVRQAAEASGMADHVVLTGTLSAEEMAAAHHMAEVCVLPVVPEPGDMEGFGIVLIEAGCAAKPVVATRAGGIPDAVEESRTGILVEPLDYPAMAQAIVRLLSDSALSARLGEAGRQRALAQFTWETAARRYVDCILDLDSPAARCRTRRRP